VREQELTVLIPFLVLLLLQVVVAAELVAHLIHKMDRMVVLAEEVLVLETVLLVVLAQQAKVIMADQHQVTLMVAQAAAVQVLLALELRVRQTVMLVEQVLFHLFQVLQFNMLVVVVVVAVLAV